MAIDFNNLMLQLKPAQPLNFGNWGGGGPDERLKLMREEFDYMKARNVEADRLKREELAAANKRQEMQLQQQREKDEAARVAALLEQKQSAMAEFEKYRQSGDIEGMDAMIPRMAGLGMGVERLGEDELGLPAFQIDMDGGVANEEEEARAAQASPYGQDVAPGAYGSMEESMGAPDGGETAVQSLDRLGALGYPSLRERGNLNEPNLDAPIATEDAFGKALAASEHYGETGEAMRGPDQADIMGSVPKNVIDVGALNAQAARRLNPALGAFADAHPEGMQESVEATNRAAAGMALPAPDALKLARELRAGPDAAMAREQSTADAAAGREATAQRTNLKINRAERDTGFANAKGASVERGVASDIYKTQKAASMVKHMLTNDDHKDDKSIAFQFALMLGSRGAQSNKDIAVAIGLDSESTIEQIQNRIHEIVEGGFRDVKKETLLNLVEKSIEFDDEVVFDLLDTIDENINSPELSESERQGWRDYKRTIPKSYRDAHGGGEEEAEDEPMPAVGRQGRTVNGQDAEEFEPTGALDEEEGEVAPDDEEAEAAAVAPDDDFENELFAQATEAGLDGEALLPIVSGESGGKGGAANKQSSAKGILQFLDSTAKRYGFKNSAEFAALPRNEQIPYVVQYFKDKGLDESSSADDYALAVAAPAFIGKPADTVVYPVDSKAWEVNAPWRPADGGDITVGSIAAYYRKHRGKKPAATEDPEDEGETGELDEDVLDILR